MGFGDGWSTFFRRMPWFLQYYMLLLPLAMSMVAVVDSGRKLPPIYWNSTNSIFNSTNRDHEIDINISDSIDIICPQYPPNTPKDQMEYYVIYMVSKKEYELCVINNVNKSLMIVNCSDPTSNRVTRYTLLIKKFQSIPGNPDFQPGQKYYFTTTSRGTEHSMDHQYHGACLKNNMKLVLNVCCPNDTQTTRPTPDYGTPPTPPKTTPRPVVTTRRPTTVRTTTTTTVTTTMKMRKTTPWTFKPINTERIPGNDNIPGENVIHANGPKNVGLISDNGGHRTSLSMACLLVFILIAHLLR